MKRRLGPIAMLGCTLLIGCADTRGPTSRPMTLRQRQDAALGDPFGYNAKDQPRVTSGGISEWDKPGLKRDIDRVMNP